MTKEEKAEALIDFCKTKRCNACECYVECNKYPYSFAYMPEVGLDACFRIAFKRDPAKKGYLMHVAAAECFTLIKRIQKCYIKITENWTLHCAMEGIYLSNLM